MSHPESASGDFFVGYLPTPSRSRQWIIASTGALLVAFGALAAVIANAQRDPGDGKWALDDDSTLTGTLYETPYPFIRTDSPNPQSFLIVDQGKRGSRERFRGLGGVTVRLQGHRIERDALLLFELDDSDNPVEVLHRDSAPPMRSATPPDSPVMLIGEIIDPKCFCGAMKPGDGKPHKACATLCIRGGIPPAFATRESTGKMAYYLLVDQSGQPFEGNSLELILPFVADMVELRGRVQTINDLKLLHISSGSIRRL